MCRRSCSDQFAPSDSPARVEHGAGRVIAQRPERAPQRPPHRVVRPGRHLAVRLLLVEPQPHERVRRRRQRLHRPRSLADHRDQLAARVHAPAGDAEQFRGPGTGGHPERDQGPVPVRAAGPANSSSNTRSGILRGMRCGSRGRNSPARSRRNGSSGLWCACARPPVPGQRERVDQRPGPRLQVIVVKRPADRLAVRDRRGAYRARRCLPGHRVHRPRAPEPGPAGRPVRQWSRSGLPDSCSHRQKSRVILSPASGRGSDLRGCVEVTVLDAAAAVFRFFA